MQQLPRVKSNYLFLPLPIWLRSFVYICSEEHDCAYELHGLYVQIRRF